MSNWTSGNRLRLLENGEQLFPRLFEAIEAAKREILLETFIWLEDEVGRELLEVLVRAAGRGVAVRATVDGYGSPGFTPEFLDRLTGVGIRVNSFDPRPTFLRIRTNILCRLHRKIVVIDGTVAFLGGINFSADHLRTYGEQSKQDYAVEVEGPVVREIHRFCRDGADVNSEPPWRRWRYWLRRFPRRMMHPPDAAQALFVYRDNSGHPTDIETMYRLGIRSAKETIVIANAYFFPGYRFIRDLRAAADRGVEIKLVMQGKPDRPLSVGAASILYDDLLSAGVRIFRYTERPLHAKVAVIDDHWATVGSSNLDPLSFGLNLEANLFVMDHGFSAALRANLEGLLERSCKEISPGERPKRSAFRRLVLTIGYHLTRRMPSWGRHVPYHEQRILPMRPTEGSAWRGVP